MTGACKLYRQTFGSNPQWVAWAPGRINLIGDHTDYNDGFVLPCAIDLGIALAAGPSESGSRAMSAQEGQTSWSNVSSPPSDWGIYPYAVARALGAETEIQAAIDASLPTAGGVSSSAALEVAFATLWNDIDNLGYDKLQIARLTQKAENETVGVQCGIMDMLASVQGVDQSALLIDTRSLNIEPIPIPQGICIALLDTGKPRTLAESAYNERRAQCEQAARSLGKSSLREVALAEVETLRDPTEQKRARHVVSENSRVLQFADALRQSDESRLGQLMAQSHASLRDDYEVSCHELDAMVDSAIHAGAIGSRLTGAGFGGAAVALVKEDQADDFLLKVEQHYKSRVKRHEPRLLVCRPSAGARMLESLGE